MPSLVRPPGSPIPREVAQRKDSKFNDSDDAFGMKVAKITRVDEINMVADLQVLTGGGEQIEIELTQGMCGPRSFFGGVPEVNSIVLIGYRRKSKQIRQAVIIGYLPVAQRLSLNFDPMTPTDPSAVDPADVAFLNQLIGTGIRYKRLKLRPGDVGGMSSSGAEFVLSRDAKFVNRAGDFIELRDVDRTLITQAIHRVENVCGVHEITGPIRRGQSFLPQDIFQTTTAPGSTTPTVTNNLIAQTNPQTDQPLTGAPPPGSTAPTSRYFGALELQALGPDVANGPNKYANTNGAVLGFFNDVTDFPPVTYNNGRRVFYPATNVGVNFEDPNTSLGALPYVERRLEMSHVTDLSQEVRDEIDGFQMTRPRKFIEMVMGTLVGNDALSTDGMRQYAEVLKPVIFDDIWSDSKDPGRFTTVAVPRGPTEPDLEVDTTAGAFLFTISPPKQQDKIDPFYCAISKQGKLFLSVPGSVVERYPSGSKNVSAEVTMGGALKMFLGAETTLGASLIADFAGGIKARIGHLAAGQAIDVEYDCPVRVTHAGAPADDIGQGIALDTTVEGNENKVLTGDYILNAYGQVVETANGRHAIKADSISQSCSSAYTGSFGGMQLSVTDKSVLNYAQLVTRNILTGGYITTILAGALLDTVTAGARTYNTAAGVTTFNNAGGAFAITVGAGAYTVNVGAGAIAMTAAAAVAITAAAAISLTASGPVSISSPSLVSIIAPQMLFGGPPAVLGVARGTPMMPPGSPSLDWITGLPLQGCAVVRSL